MGEELTKQEATGDRNPSSPGLEPRCLSFSGSDLRLPQSRAALNGTSIQPAVFGAFSHVKVILP